MKQSSILKVSGRHTLSTQTLRLMEQNEKLRLENISLGRRLQIITVKTSLLKKRLLKIMTEFENDKRGGI